MQNLNPEDHSVDEPELTPRATPKSPEPAEPVVRYGILGCAGIANKIARAITLSHNSTITVVASRTPKKAEEFIQRNALDDASISTYDELINSDKVDIVYIPIPSSLRLPWIVKAIEKKKHIISEKPLGSPKTVEVIIPSCRAKNVQFMDGIEFMHHPRFKDMTEKLHKVAIIGKVQRIVSSFSVPCLDNNNIRNIPDLEPLGVLGDLGIHNIRISLWGFDYEQPLFVKAICHKRNASGAMQDISAWLFFSGDRVASFDCSYHCPLRQHAEIVGETGSIEVRQFVIPPERRCTYSTHYSTLNMSDTTEVIKEEEFLNNIQEVEMITRMSRIAHTGKVESFWPQVTLMTERILDACRRSIDRSGELVEFMKGQVWFQMSGKERRLSVMGSDRNFQAISAELEQYQTMVLEKEEHKMTGNSPTTAAVDDEYKADF